jgi:hypothetical protein
VLPVLPHRPEIQLVPQLEEVGRESSRRRRPFADAASGLGRNSRPWWSRALNAWRLDSANNSTTPEQLKGKRVDQGRSPDQATRVGVQSVESWDTQEHRESDVDGPTQRVALASSDGYLSVTCWHKAVLSTITVEAENRSELAMSFLARATSDSGLRSATSHQWCNIEFPARNSRALSRPADDPAGLARSRKA